MLAENATGKAFNMMFPVALLLADAQVQGRAISAQELDSLALSLALQFENEVELYTLEDIRVDSSVDSSQYAERVVGVFDRNRDVFDRRGIENELGIVANALGTVSGRKDLSKLDLNITYYNQMKDELLTMRVHPLRRHDHLTIINSLHGISESLKLTQKLDKDPLLGVLGLDKYREHTDTLSLTLLKLVTE
jgi:hypothetical protein